MRHRPSHYAGKGVGRQIGGSVPRACGCCCIGLAGAARGVVLLRPLQHPRVPLPVTAEAEAGESLPACGPAAAAGLQPWPRPLPWVLPPAAAESGAASWGIAAVP